MTLELVDYSRTANDDWDSLAQAIKAEGKVGSGRYCVNDLAPNGRGIGFDEYAAYKRANLDVFFYWESTEGWMLDGFAAGAQAAVNAQQNLNALEQNLQAVVYFACDVDAAPEDQAAIDECLRGCAEVLGIDRVGLYAGYWPLMRSMQNGTAKWGAQTSAWSGGNLLDAAHLYQYGYNHNINGTDCDLVRALQPNYGQVGAVPPKPVKPVYVKRIPVPGEWETKIIDHRLYLKHGGIVTAAHGVKLRQFADREAPEVDAPIKPGKRVRVRYVVEGDGDLWYISPGGARMLAKGFVE